MKPIAEIFALNTDLALNCLDGVTEADLEQRLPGGGNSMTFLFAHMADARHLVADLIGEPLPNPLTEYLGDTRSIDDVPRVPPVAVITEAWMTVSAHLQVLLADLRAEEITRPTAQSYPIPGGTVAEALTFLAQHDTYHLGQLAFVRRQLGYAAMRYTRRRHA